MLSLIRLFLSADRTGQSRSLLYTLGPGQSIQEDSSCNTSFSSSSASLEELPFLFQLIQEQKWYRIQTALKSHQGYSLCQQRDESDLTCLALALVQSAPLEVIEDMIDTDPGLLNVCDKYGATALHIGCLNGISLEAIEYLLEKKKSLARELDFDCRSALHHAVEYICCDGGYDGDSISENDSLVGSDVVMVKAIGTQPQGANEAVHQYSHHPNASNLNVNLNSSSRSVSIRSYNLDVLQCLCDAAPEMIHVKDNDGQMPIDLVQIIKIKTKVNTEKYKFLDSVYYFLRQVIQSTYKILMQ